MPETSERHEHRVLYKYFSREAAAATLSTMTTRWSSPLLYNDPFDTPDTLSFTFPVEAVPAVAMMLMESIVEDPARRMPREASVAGAIASARAAADSEKKRIALLAAATKAGMDAKGHLQFTNAIWKTKLEVMRVFCIGEVFDDLLMWAHYAESHCGVVMGFKCMDDTDTNLCTARPVVYSKQRPLSADTADDWVCRYFDGNMIKVLPDAEPERQRVLDAMIFTKSDHWSYEKEWRCFGKEDYQCLAISRKRANDLRCSVTLRPEEVDSVYIGCRMPPEDERVLRRLIQEKLRPETRVLRGRQSGNLFALEFSPA